MEVCGVGAEAAAQALTGVAAHPAMTIPTATAAMIGLATTTTDLAAVVDRLTAQKTMTATTVLAIVATAVRTDHHATAVMTVRHATAGMIEHLESALIETQTARTAAAMARKVETDAALLSRTGELGRPSQLMTSVIGVPSSCSNLLPAFALRSCRRSSSRSVRWWRPRS